MKSASRKPQSKRKYFKSRGFSRLFCFSWEQRKFSDLVETRRGLTYKPTDIREKGVRVLRSSNIDEDRFVLKPDDVFVDESAINIDFAKENDILITAANGSSRLVGKHAIVSEISDKSTVHGGFMLLGTSDETYFANAFMSSAWYKRFIDLYVSGGNGAIGNLNKSDLDDQDILVPQKKEQQAIGHFFENLDRLITLHQSNSIGYIFKVRAYTNAWEQRKLGDIVDVRSGKDYKHLSEGNIPVYGTGGYMLSVNQALSYDEDAIGIGRKGTIDKPYILKAPFWTVDTLFYAVPSQNSDLDFVFDIFQNIDWKKKDESTGVPSLSKTAINEIYISAPCLEEQQIIGSYFSKIDRLITLHQRERKNRLFGGKNVKQYNFSRSVLQLLRAMDTRLQRRGCSQGDYG